MKTDLKENRPLFLFEARPWPGAVHSAGLQPRVNSGLLDLHGRLFPTIRGLDPLPRHKLPGLLDCLLTKGGRSVAAIPLLNDPPDPKTCQVFSRV
jgi:hypothetical protein